MATFWERDLVSVTSRDAATTSASRVMAQPLAKATAALERMARKEAANVVAGLLREADGSLA
jgi:hypothetical protein